jgi:hypothetical protein
VRLSINLIRTGQGWYVQRYGQAYPVDADDTFSRTPSAAVRNERNGTSRLLGTSR